MNLNLVRKTKYTLVLLVRKVYDIHYSAFGLKSPYLKQQCCKCRPYMRHHKRPEADVSYQFTGRAGETMILTLVPSKTLLTLVWQIETLNLREKSQLTRSSARFSDSFENWMSLPGVPWFEMERTFHVKTLSRVTPLMENMCNFGQPHSCFSEDFETLVCWRLTCELHAYVLGDSMMTFISISLVFDTVKYMMTYHWRHRKCNSHTWHSW